MLQRNNDCDQLSKGLKREEFRNRGRLHSSPTTTAGSPGLTPPHFRGGEAASKKHNYKMFDGAQRLFRPTCKYQDCVMINM